MEPTKNLTPQRPDSRNGSDKKRLDNAALLWRLATAYPTQTIHAETIEQYLESLAGIEPEYVAIGCNEARDESRFFPSASEIRRHALDARADAARLRANEDLHSTLREAERIGSEKIPWDKYFRNAGPRTIEKFLVLVGRINAVAGLPRYPDRTWDGRANPTITSEEHPDPQVRAVATALVTIIRDRDMPSLVALADEVGVDRSDLN